MTVDTTQQTPAAPARVPPDPAAVPRPALLAWLPVDRDPPADRADTRVAVATGARLSANYLLMNAAATLIAGYGLLANSEAVIIGAMLIAMLYGPILGIGMALAELDGRLLGRALQAEIVGALWVFAIGFGLGWFHGDVPVSDQMLARTAPNILDMMIALVGGAAGAYATAAPRVSGAAVGVAIATALCPPLAACGILLAHGFPGLAGGALVLFLTNLTAIAVAAMVVFLLLGHRGTRAGAVARPAWSARLAPLVTLVLLGAVLVDAFRESVEDSALRSTVQRALEREIAGSAGARVVEVRLTRERGRRIATAVIRSPRPFTAEMVAALDDRIDAAAGRDVDLHARIVLVEELTRDGPVYPAAGGSERARLGR